MAKELQFYSERLGDVKWLYSYGEGTFVIDGKAYPVTRASSRSVLVLNDRNLVLKVDTSYKEETRNEFKFLSTVVLPEDYPFFTPALEYGETSTKYGDTVAWAVFEKLQESWPDDINVEKAGQEKVSELIERYGLWDVYPPTGAYHTNSTFTAAGPRIFDFGSWTKDPRKKKS